MAFVSALICFLVKDNITRYAFMCFLIAGLYRVLPMVLIWASETMPLPAEKRVVVIAITSAVGNIYALYGSYLWLTSDAPHYSKGFIAVNAVGAVIAAAAPLLFRVLPRFPTETELEIVEGQVTEMR